MEIRKRRFRQRVELERSVLQLVNDSDISSAPLNGLSHAAIAAWEGDSTSVGSNTNISELAKLLREISLRCQLDADCSRDVFEDDELVQKGTLDQAVFALKARLHG